MGGIEIPIDEDLKKLAKEEENPDTIHKYSHSIEKWLEKILFAGRWILAPMYLILIIVLAFILYRFAINAWEFVYSMIFTPMTDNDWIIKVLELLDLTLVANLVLIVAFSGYENFISKMEDVEKSSKKLSWMGLLDFSGLKLKIIGSIVAISLIELLQDFLNASNGINNTVEFWRIALHLVFLISGFIFAKMEMTAEKRHEMKQEGKLARLKNKF